MASNIDEARQEAQSLMKEFLGTLGQRKTTEKTQGLKTTFERPNDLPATQKDFKGLKGSDNGQSAQDAYNKAYTNQNRQAAADVHKEMQQGVQSNWNEQAKQRIVPWFSQNLGKDDPYGNLNQKSFNDTLNLSRQADVYNNRLRWHPGLVGRTTYHLGSTEGTRGEAFRREPIETQEMRQMRANENISNLSRQRQANLQGDINQYGLDLQRQSDQFQAQFAHQLGIGQDAVNRAMQNALIQGEYTQINSAQLQQKLNRFMQELALEIQTKKGGYIYDIYQKCGPILTSYVSQVLTGTPGMSMQELMWGETIQDAIDSAGPMTSKQKLIYMNEIMNLTNGAITASNITGLSNNVKGAWGATWDALKGKK